MFIGVQLRLLVLFCCWIENAGVSWLVLVLELDREC